MVTAAEIADAWEKDRKTTEKWLDEYVDENPNLVGVLIATAVKTSMDVGAGFVDVLRLGQGAAKGGWGWAEDALRVVGIVGPLGRGAKMVHSARHARAARLITDPGGPICSFVNSTKALRHTGQRLFATVDDFARTILGPGVQPGGIPLNVMVSHLRRIGAAVSGVKNVTSVKQVVKMLPRDGSVVLVSVRAVRNGANVGGHAIYFFYDKLGRLRIADRTGVYKSLGELARRYSVTEFIPRGAAHMKNLFMKFVGPKGTATLAVQVNALVAPTEGLVDEISQPTSRPRVTLPPTYAGKLPPVRYLTGVRARLMNLGYYDGPIRGPYDDKSRQAVIAFQKDHPPLAVDGIPGPKTQARLAKEYGA